jgi:hypothetical protein
VWREHQNDEWFDSERKDIPVDFGQKRTGTPHF